MPRASTASQNPEAHCTLEVQGAPAPPPFTTGGAQLSFNPEPIEPVSRRGRHTRPASRPYAAQLALVVQPGRQPVMSEAAPSLLVKTNVPSHVPVRPAMLQSLSLPHEAKQ